MYFIRGNLIRMTGGDTVRVAMSEIGDMIYVGFVGHSGADATDAFEHLVQFVWQERYSQKTFADIRWFDLQADDLGDGAWLKAFPVILDGYVRRRRFYGLLGYASVDGPPRIGDECIVDGEPEWHGSIAIADLPPAFQDAVGRQFDAVK